MKCAVLGLGYVGLVIAVRAAEVNHEVVGLEVDPSKVQSLQEGRSYIEDVSDERLASVRGNFTAVNALSSDIDFISDFDIGIITVPTPLKGSEPDLSYVESAGRMLASYLRPGATIVLESTTYPGTTEGLLADVIYEVSDLKPGEDYHLGFSPERIDPGNTVMTFEKTPKLVSGVDSESLAVIKEFYDSLVEQTVPVSSPRVAEITKLYENTFAQVNIALLNEMTQICRSLDIDAWEMIEAGQTKGHSMMDLWRPGPGVGGHCLPIDSMYLNWLYKDKFGSPFKFAELANTVNRGMPKFVVDRAASILVERNKSLEKASVLIVGVTYKPGSNDLRESPALDVISEFQDRGAQVTITDPYVTDWDSTPVLSLDELSSINEFTLVVVVTNHPDYDYDMIAKSASLVLDTRHHMNPSDNVKVL